MNNEFLCLEATVDQDIFAEPFFLRKKCSHVYFRHMACACALIIHHRKISMHLIFAA